MQKNYKAVDAALAGLQEVKYPAEVTSNLHTKAPVPAEAPAFVKDVLGEMIAGRGDELPTSAMPEGGVYPTGTTQYENATSPSWCRSGIPTPAFSAVSAL